MTLYEIREEILNCVDEETGEVVDTEKLKALEMEHDAKISNIACWIKDLRAEAEALKNEKQALEKRQKAAENKAESLKEFLAVYLEGEKFKDNRVSISYRRSESVGFTEDFNIDDLPDDYVKVTKEPRKTLIKEAFAEGMVVPGCFIEEKNNIQIR
jgi:hypothetical protein